MWLLLLRTLLSRFIHIVACISTYSFLWLNNIPLYGYTTFCLSTHLFLDISVVSFGYCAKAAVNLSFCMNIYFLFFSVQFSCSVTPWTAAHLASLFIINSQAYSNSCPLSWWCHPTISSSIIPFSSHLQSSPASGSFLVLCIRWPKLLEFQL